MPKISALPPAGTLADDDETPFVDDSAAQTKKFTLSGLKTWLQSLTGWITTAMIGDDQVTVPKIKDLVAGSNANGTYQKFPDGLLICQTDILVAGPNNNGGSAIFYTSTASTWTFPFPFIAVPAVTVGHDSGATDMWGGGRNSSSTSADIALYCGRSRTGPYTVHVTAIGRWK
jgi:hypothetical protein